MYKHFTLKSVVPLATIVGTIIAISVPLASAAVTKFAQGYYGHFDINLAHMNFAPQSYDYINILPYVLIGSLILSVVFVLMLYAADRIASLATNKIETTKATEWLSAKTNRLSRGKIKTIVALLDAAMIVLLSIFAFLLIHAITTYTFTLGKAAAESTTTLTSISAEREPIQKIIIYKNVGETILKPYDTSSKKFLDGFDITYGATYSTRTIER